MKEVNKDVLKDASLRLMFTMEDEEYDLLLEEFHIIQTQLGLMSKIAGVDDVTPMTFPFDLELDDSYLRDDSYDNEICFDDMKINVKEYEGNRVKVPKVVE